MNNADTVLAPRSLFLFAAITICGCRATHQPVTFEVVDDKTNRPIAGVYVVEQRLNVDLLLGADGQWLAYPPTGPLGLVRTGQLDDAHHHGFVFLKEGYLQSDALYQFKTKRVSIISPLRDFKSGTSPPQVPADGIVQIPLHASPGD